MVETPKTEGEIGRCNAHSTCRIVEVDRDEAGLGDAFLCLGHEIGSAFKAGDVEAAINELAGEPPGAAGDVEGCPEAKGR